MSNYTKGPWTCCETTLAGQCIGFHITAPRYGSIAPLAESVNGDRYSADDLRANGRLLAAAPDLLEALERLTRVASVELEATRPDVLEQARAAIAKATGESK